MRPICNPSPFYSQNESMFKGRNHVKLQDQTITYVWPIHPVNDQKTTSSAIMEATRPIAAPLCEEGLLAPSSQKQKSH